MTCKRILRPLMYMWDVYPVPDGYVVFRIVDATEEAVRPFDEVKSRIHKSISKILLNQKVWNEAAELRGLINTPEDLDRIAAENELRVYVTKDSFRVDSKMPGGLKKDKDFLKDVNAQFLRVRDQKGAYSEKKFQNYQM